MSYETDRAKMPSPEMMEEIKDYVLKKTGCGGMVMILLSERVPCPDKLSGVPCASPHLSLMGVAGVKPEYISGLLEQAGNQVDERIEGGLPLGF